MMDLTHGDKTQRLISFCCMLSTADIKDDDSSKIIKTPLSRAMSNLIAV
jgi:hypothetical protein